MISSSLWFQTWRSPFRLRLSWFPSTARARFTGDPKATAAGGGVMGIESTSSKSKSSSSEDERRAGMGCGLCRGIWNGPVRRMGVTGSGAMVSFSRSVVVGTWTCCCCCCCCWWCWVDGWPRWPRGFPPLGLGGMVAEVEGEQPLLSLNPRHKARALSDPDLGTDLIIIDLI